MHFFLLLSLLIIPISSLSPNSSSLCPIDFNYVNTFPWDTSACTTTTAATSATATQNCCHTLRSLFGIGLADHLKKTSTFFLPNLQSSISCLADFQSHLSAAAVRQPLSGCLTAGDFVANPSNCAGIVTLSDWVDKVGSTPTLDSSCNEDLTGWCSSCLDSGMAVNSRLVSLSRNVNSTMCFTFTVLYVAGIASGFGPEDIRTASCVFRIPLLKPRSKKRSSKTTVFAISGALVGVVIFLVVIFVYRKRNNKTKETNFHIDYVRSVKAPVLPNTGAKWFRIAELDVATNGFSQENFIGKGGFGIVYKGTLSNGTVVAVKKMTSFDTEADNDFVNEAEIISKVRHRNLLPLRGFCATSNLIEGNERYLVYDFMPNGSLHDHIFNKTKSNQRLSWPQRKSIILDVAKGLWYLHNGIKPAIFHRDIKATNILLDANMKALVADFGLAKESKDGKSLIITRVAGTYGYVAPEYALYGQLTEKSDVYSFGIIILEIMSGRKVLEEAKGGDSGTVLITDWVWEMVRSDRMEEVFDLMGEEETLPKGVMGRFVRIGLLCAHAMVAFRPTIWEALKMLEGDIDIPRLPDRPLPLTLESLRSNVQRSNMSFWSSSEGSGASSSLST